MILTVLQEELLAVDSQNDEVLTVMHSLKLPEVGR